MDFSEHYTDINSNAFIDNWAEFGAKLKEVFKNDYQSNVSDIEWSEDVMNFLILIKLFPRSAGRNALASRLAFGKAVKKLIIFSSVIFDICINLLTD